MQQKNNIAALIPSYLANSTTFNVVVTDLEGKYSYVNDQFQEQFSHLSTDFIGTPFATTIHPDDLEKCNLAANECIKDPTKVVSLQVRKPEGESNLYFWTKWDFSLLKDLNSEPVGILCIGHDISRIARVNYVAKAYATRLDIILKNITDAYFVLDQELRIRAINQAFKKVMEITKAEAIGMSIWDIVNKGNNPAIATAIEQVQKEQVSTQNELFSTRLNKWFLVSIYPSSEGLTVFIQDITELKKSEEKVRQSEYKLRAMVNSKNESKVLVDTNFKIIFFNNLANVYAKQFAQKELQMGEDILGYISGEYSTIFKTALTHALQGEKSENERELFLEEESSIWIKYYFYPVYGEQGEIIGVAIYLVGITGKKRAEKRIKRQLEALREIAFMQSHVMRRPVSSILGLISLFEKDKLEGENLELMEYLERATKELDDVIHHIVRQANQLESEEF